MSDLYDQCRILYHIYKANHDGGGISASALIADEDLKFMHGVGNLIPALYRLKRTGYVEEDDEGNEDLQLSRDGLIATETLFRKFLPYMKESNPDKLDTWINTLERHKNSIWELIRDSYHFIVLKREPLVEKAFYGYLNELGSLENVTAFEVEGSEPDIGTLIDDMFQHLGDINRLFEHKLGRKLFCIPAEAHSTMNKATKGKEINYTDFIASVALVLDGICEKEIGGLAEPGKNLQGSINKIESIFKHNKINYNPNTITTLRAIRQLRNMTFPIHDAGSQVIVQLQRLGLSFPVENSRDATCAILQSLNSCLVEMKSWLS
jgi:hypothetical protein